MCRVGALLAFAGCGPTELGLERTLHRGWRAMAPLVSRRSILAREPGGPGHVRSRPREDPPCISPPREEPAGLATPMERARARLTHEIRDRRRVSGSDGAAATVVAGSHPGCWRHNLSVNPSPLGAPGACRASGAKSCLVSRSNGSPSGRSRSTRSRCAWARPAWGDRFAHWTPSPCPSRPSSRRRARCPVGWSSLSPPPPRMHARSTAPDSHEPSTASLKRPSRTKQLVTGDCNPGLVVASCVWGRPRRRRRRRCSDGPSCVHRHQPLDRSVTLLPQP